MKKIMFLLMPFFLCQCASIDRSVGLGVGIGAGAGFGAAQLANYNTKGNVVLAISGALIGGAIAALLHKDTPPTIMQVPVSLSSSDIPPPLKSAEKDVLYVPDKIEGDRFEEGHRVYVIKKPAHWQLRDKEKKEAPLEEEAENNE